MTRPGPGARTCALVLILALSAACSSGAAKHAHFESGIRLLAAGNSADAVIEFRNAVEGDPQWGMARLKLAEAYEANGDPERAYREYLRAADLLPDDSAAQLKAVTYLLAVGQFEDARTRVERLLERDPHNVDALILHGNALAQLKDVEGALAQINQAIELEPQRSQSYTNLAMIKLAQGERDAARTAFERAVALNPKSVTANLALANFHWSVGETTAAEAALKRAFEADEQSILANRTLATFYVATGNAMAAEPHLRFVAVASNTLAAQFALADYYIATGRDGEARKVLEPLATREAAVPGAIVRLAGMAYVAGRVANAHRQLDALLATDPHFVPALLMKARWLLSEGRREQALELARTASGQDPRDAVAHYIRGVAESASHRTADAVNSFTQVLRLNPRAVVARVHLSRLHLARNAVDSAVLFAEEALRQAPGSLDARLALIRAWIARGDHVRAAAALVTLKKAAPDSAAVHALDGSLQLIQKNRAAARLALQRAMQLDPGSIEALSGLTTLDVVAGNLEAARNRIETILDTGSEHPELLVMAGKVFLASKQFDRAETLLKRAAELDPLSFEPFTLLVSLYAQQDRLQSGASEFDVALQHDPQDLSARMLGALLAHARGAVADAETRYRQILQLEPRAALAANNLAAIYVAQNRHLDVAQQAAESASTQRPADPDIQDTLGLVYLRRQRAGLAARRFERSIAINPDNATYHYHLALAHSQSGETERARRALQVALKLRPEFDDAQQALASLQ